MTKIEATFAAAGFSLTNQGGNIMNYQRTRPGYIQIISDEDGGGPVTDNALDVVVGTYRLDERGVLIEEDIDNSELLAAGWSPEDVLAVADGQAFALREA